MQTQKRNQTASAARSVSVKKTNITVNRGSRLRGLATALVMGALTSSAVQGAVTVVTTNTDTGVKYGNFSVGGDVVLNAQTGSTGWTLTSLEIFADFNDGSAPDPGAMTIGVWDPIEQVIFGQFDTSGIAEEGFGAHLATTNPFGIYIPAETAFSILIEERDGGDPNVYSFVGG